RRGLRRGAGSARVGSAARRSARAPALRRRRIRRELSSVSARDLHGTSAPWGGDDFRVVGKPLRKVDGLAKATGAALYADDIALPGMLHAKTLRSPHPHARIVRIDASKALALPGVHAVITGADLPIRYGVIPWTPD